MKKIIFLFIILILLLNPSAALGADALYRMLHTEEVESFRKDQDGLIVGQIIDKQGDKFSVQVLKVISGRVKANTILISADFSYGWSQTKPAIKDFAVMSLKRKLNHYQRAWGIFKADSGDYQTLRLVDSNFKSGSFGDLACIQWYVNSGGTEKDFSFEGGNAYVRRPNGEVIQIYTNAEKAPIKTYPKENPASTMETNPAVETIPPSFNVLVMLAANLLTAAIVALYLNNRR